MTTVDNALEKARADAQILHQNIEAATAKNEAALRAGLETSAAKAKALASELSAMRELQIEDVKRHAKTAVAHLESAAQEAKAIGSVTETQLQQRRRAMLADVRAALTNIGEAVAAHRSALRKV